MLTPSEIDLLRQDLRAALKVLGQDEIEDAQALLRQNGFRSDELEITQRSDPSAPYPSVIAGAIVVVRRSTGAEKSYSAGHGSPWLEQFEADLAAGYFDRLP
jgi:DNA-directed RNA polymerase subunit H (RpoH/RPB5)